MAKRKRRAFTKEFKAEAVRVVQESGKTGGGGGAGAGSDGDGAAELGAAGRDRRGPGRAGGADDGRSGRSWPQLRRESADVADGARHPKKSDGLLRQGERVRFAFIAAEKAAFPVAVLCRMLAGVARRVLRLAQARPVPGARPRRRAARGRDRGDPRGESAALRQPARPRGAAGARAGRESQARGAPDARTGAWRPAAGGGSGSRRTPGIPSPSRPTCWRAQFDGARARRGVGDRHHLHPDRGRLALPGGDPRPVLARRRRLGDERAHHPASSRSTPSAWRWRGVDRPRGCCITPTAAVSTRAATTRRPSAATGSSAA